MKVQKIIIAGLIGIFILITSACQPPALSDDTGTVAETPTPVPESTEKLDDFEERLKGVQTGNFDYVFAFRRKDGGAFDKEDKRFVKQNAPSSTNQWVLTKDDKVVIAGSNYKFTPENLENLKSRFNIENYSKIIDDDNTNTNVIDNPDKNTNIVDNRKNKNINANVIDNRNKNTNKAK